MSCALYWTYSNFSLERSSFDELTEWVKYVPNTSSQKYFYKTWISNLLVIWAEESLPDFGTPVYIFRAQELILGP